MEDPPEDIDGPAPRVVDARGHRCPAPTLRLRRALGETASGGRVLLIADDPLARIDVPVFAGEAGVDLLSTSVEGAVLKFLVEKR